ncbi:MAG TPA: hypothetical protein VHA80_06675 [Solirubrobacterales bacterium]|nr:hypothetical protein [Solirubrobacterales bacterium]
MGWTCGALDGPFSSRAAIAFDLGEEFAGRVIATARYGTVIYAAVRSADGEHVFGLVLLAERRDGVLCTKPAGEDEGPVQDRCPARILDLLSEPVDDGARDWRRRCRARLARGRPRVGQRVRFARPLAFTDGSEHGVLTWIGGSRFRDAEGRSYRVPDWQALAYALLEDG